MLKYWKNGSWHELQISGGSYTAGSGISISDNIISVVADSTLTLSGKPADSLAVGTALSSKANSTHTHTASDVTGLSSVATTGNYSDLQGTPTIPSKVSDLQNDSGFELSSNKENTISDSNALYPSSKAVKTALQGKADLSHTHEINAVQGLQSALNEIDSKQDILSQGTGIQISENTVSVVTDATLATQGMPADAKAVSDALSSNSTAQVLWQGEMRIGDNTFALSKAANLFTLIVLVPKSTYPPIFITTLSNNFDFRTYSASAFYSVGGTVSWSNGTKSVSFVRSLAYKETSWNAGQASDGANPLIGKIIGIR